MSEYVPFTMTKTENRKRLKTRSLSKSVLFSISISTNESLAAQFLPPANVVCEGYVFTPVSHSVHRGGGVRGSSGGVRSRGCA